MIYEHTRICKHCGKEFTYTTSNPRAMRVSCSECRSITAKITGKKGLDSSKRNIPSEIMRVCNICGQVFTYIRKHSSGYKRLYCPECAKDLHRQRAWQRRVEVGLIQKPNVGSGHNQKNRSDPDYQVGSQGYRKLALQHVPPEQWKCYYCGATYSTSKARPNVKLALEVHHIDGNPCNNDPSNWRIVCKQCHHAIEHPKKK